MSQYDLDFHDLHDSGSKLVFSIKDKENIYTFTFSQMFGPYLVIDEALDTDISSDHPVKSANIGSTAIVDNSEWVSSFRNVIEFQYAGKSPKVYLITTASDCLKIIAETEPTIEKHPITS